MNVSLWQAVDGYVQSGDINGAASHLEKLLRAETQDRFVTLADSRMTNPPDDVINHINAFIAVCRSKFELKSIYLEMNGFDVNYDRWYFDSFGYTTYRDDPDDHDWLCEWASPDWDTFTLTGLEQTQEDFRWYMENRIWEQKTHNDAKEVAVLLVMVRFLQLVEAALATGDLIASVPVLATAHDFDIVARFRP